jgi:hypothetical protein
MLESDGYMLRKCYIVTDNAPVCGCKDDPNKLDQIECTILDTEPKKSVMEVLRGCYEGGMKV